jgi:hypothetical protein
MARGRSLPDGARQDVCPVADPGHGRRPLRRRDSDGHGPSLEARPGGPARATMPGQLLRLVSAQPDSDGDSIGDSVQHWTS